LIRPPADADALVCGVHHDSRIATWLTPNVGPVGLDLGLPKVLFHSLRKLVWRASQTPLNR
jgi:hypothetical protein